MTYLSVLNAGQKERQLRRHGALANTAFARQDQYFVFNC